MKTVLMALVLAGWLWPGSSWGLGMETWKCVGVENPGKMLTAHNGVFRGTNYNVQEFDRDGNGYTDLILIYEYVGNSTSRLRPFPVRYIVFTGPAVQDADEWVDTMGNGRCADIKKVEEVPTFPPNTGQDEPKCDMDEQHAPPGSV